MGLLRRLRQLLHRPITCPKASVRSDEKGVSCHWPDGHFESVDRNDLKAVEIKNTDEGPFVQDVFFVLYGNDSSCVVPLDAERFDVFFERLRRLPGFDSQAVVAAMSCTDDANFLC